MDAINLLEKAGLVDALWSPRVVGELNDVQIKVARIHGDFVWHDHEDTDELFLVIQGSMRVEYRDRAVTLNEGEMHIVPKALSTGPQPMRNAGASSWSRVAWSTRARRVAI